MSAHISGVGARSLLAAVASALVFSGTPAKAVVHASRHGVAATRSQRRAGSPYPAGALRPRRIARRGEFAHSTSSTGGTGAAPGGAPGGSGSGSETSGPRPAVRRRPVPHGRRPKPKPKPGLHGNPARALLAYKAMQSNFYIQGSGLYEGEPYSYLWPFSQALAATVSVAYMTGQGARETTSDTRDLHVRTYGLERYWGPAGLTLPGRPPEQEEPSTPAEYAESEGGFRTTLPSFNGNVVPPGGVSYYDDNEWVGIELARLYELRHEPVLLERAEQIMTFVMAGWQDDPKLACPGGVPFSDAPRNTDRNTVTDGPAAELGVQLYRLTGDPAYLQFATMAYEWVRTCLRTPEELYFDHIRRHGAIGQALWSYNQGSMIGAGVLLYQATGNSAYLYQARQTAKSALTYFTNSRLLSEPPFFVSVYLRNLMYLDSVTRDPPGPRLAQSYVNYAWMHQRLKDNLFVHGSPPATELLTQAAIVQVYALLSEPAAAYF